MRIAVAFVCFAVLASRQASAQNSQASPQSAPVRYIISLANLSQHLVRVKLLLAPGASERDVQLPVWNALYQVRDFSQYVNWVKAKSTGGEPLAVRKVDKTTWHLSGAAQGVEVEYEIFADQSGPFGAQLNPQHAFFNLAEILMYPVDGRNSPDRSLVHRPARRMADRIRAHARRRWLCSLRLRSPGGCPGRNRRLSGI